MTKHKKHNYLYTNFWLDFMLKLNKKNQILPYKPIKPCQIKVIPNIHKRTYVMAVLNYQT